MLAMRAAGHCPSRWTAASARRAAERAVDDLLAQAAADGARGRKQPDDARGASGAPPRRDPDPCRDRARRRRRPALGRARRPACDHGRATGPADGAHGDAARVGAARRSSRRSPTSRPASRAARAPLVRSAGRGSGRQQRLMANVGLLTVSDGRASVHRDVGGFAAEVEERIAAALEDARPHRSCGRHEVVWTNELAVSEARRIADGRPDLTIVNVPSGRSRTSPCWRPARSGPAAAAVEHRPACTRAWSGCLRPAVRSTRSAGAPAAWGDPGRIPGWWRRSACMRGRRRRWPGCAGRPSAGSVAGRWGCTRRPRTPTSGRAVRSRRRGDRPVGDRPPGRAGRRGRGGQGPGLARGSAGVHYDGDRLTPEILDRQIRSYLAMRELIEEWRLDFSGIKAQPELTHTSPRWTSPRRSSTTRTTGTGRSRRTSARPRRTWTAR